MVSSWAPWKSSPAPAENILLPSIGAADVSTLSWLNVLLGTIWPHANKALISMVHDEVTPRLREALPQAFKNLRFSSFTLGDKTPDFGPVEVVRHSENAVQLDLEMRYFSDVDIHVETGTGGIGFGISELTFAGRLCIVLKPLLDKKPVIGGCQIYFANQPRIELKFSGLAALAEMPGIAGAFQNAVDDSIRNAMVLPNKKIHYFTRDESLVSLMDIARTDAVGVLRARVLSARNLAGANWQFGTSAEKFTSDPYCVLGLGSDSHKTSTVSGTTDPIWPQSEPSAYFVVQHREQSMTINVFDEDKGLIKQNFVAFLGKFQSSAVRRLTSEWPVVRKDHVGGTIRGQCVRLDTSKVVTDMLHVNDPVNRGIPSEIDVELEWFDLVSDVARTKPPAMAGAPQVVVFLELHSGEGFPEAMAFEKKGMRWRASLQGEDKIAAQSKPGQYHLDEPEFPEIPMHGRLFPVVDKLKDKGMPLHEIADVCDTDVDTLQQYLKAKAEFEAKHAPKIRSEDDPETKVDLHWQEILTLFVQNPDNATVLIELLDGEDRRKGALEPIPVKSLLGSPGLEMPRKQFHLAPPQGNKPGGISAWLFPMCTSVVAPGKVASVRMGLSAKVRHIVPGDTPPQIRSEAGTSLPVQKVANAPEKVPTPARSLNNGYPLQNGAAQLQGNGEGRRGHGQQHGPLYENVDMPPPPPPPPVPPVVHRNL